MTTVREWGERLNWHRGSWSQMVSRCHDPKSKDFKWYGAKGISVFAKWRESFPAFAEDVLREIGPRPDGHQIDRIDNERGYEPGNVRWVTSKRNNNNRGDNKLIEYRGEKLTAAQWADRFGLPRQQVSNRINRGWDLDRVFNQPLREQATVLTIDGEEGSITYWVKKTGRPRSTINNRLKQGMDPKEAVFGELKHEGEPQLICPRCKERPKRPGDGYCTPCRREKSLSRYHATKGKLNG